MAARYLRGGRREAPEVWKSEAEAFPIMWLNLESEIYDALWLTDYAERYLVDRLPVMITPRWVRTECQPIGIRNVLDYLVGCLETPATAGGSFDIGGPDVVTYRELMHAYAQEAGLRRRFILPIPEPRKDRARKRTILTGDVPSPLNPPSGCRFHTRCAFVRDICRTVMPATALINPFHWPHHLLSPPTKTRPIW